MVLAMHPHRANWLLTFIHVGVADVDVDVDVGVGANFIFSSSNKSHRQQRTAAR